MKRQARPRGVAEPIASYGSDRGEVVLYRAPDGTVTVDVRLERETIWLNLNQMADLFARDKFVISRHLRNVFKEGELDRESTVAYFATVQEEAGRQVTRQIDFTIWTASSPSAAESTPSGGHSFASGPPVSCASIS